MAYEFKINEPPPHIHPADWGNWKWQFKNALTSMDQFKAYFSLSEDEEAAFLKSQGLFQIRVTPYYANLASSIEPIRKILMPHMSELTPGAQQMLDPLGERKNNPAPRIIHRYPDRCLFLVTDFCSVYCRYCTRKHFTGKDQAFPSKTDYQLSLDYIANTPQIREVILSGGDPLTLGDQRLEKILSDLKQIPHVDLIRVGSRIPTVAPMRITDELVSLFKRYKPIYFMAHFNHPKEITAESAHALEKLVDHGVPVFNQMVLLNGVNNHPAVVYALSRRLLSLRVKPYYMFQCDPSEGTDHLRTSIEESESIQRQLWGRASGLALPNLSLDIPEGGGKAPLFPDFEVGRSEKGRVYTGWDGVRAEYVNPAPENHQLPADYKDYT